ncbi:NUDIX domain-containing protein [Haloferula sp. A504]|uniref:NUDIX domain-containing protein n=1 Tax=Haloferula sp. A504 TaxID=3373601 RepID=UPI0031BECA4A|nr:NUDIX domain-containing protein [Verrucomicrobiaceae bacterium E54]
MVRFRPNVAALMTRRDGSLLICERWQVPGAWQFPQGGVDPGESETEALYREVREEIGLRPRDYEVIESKSGYRYLYPEEVRRKKVRKHGCQGQEQVYFLCKLRKKAAEIDTNQRPREFAAHRWIQPGEFDLKWLPSFKREVYRQVMRDFFRVKL